MTEWRGGGGLTRDRCCQSVGVTAPGRDGSLKDGRRTAERGGVPDLGDVWRGLWCMDGGAGSHWRDDSRVREREEEEGKEEGAVEYATVQREVKPSVGVCWGACGSMRTE